MSYFMTVQKMLIIFFYHNYNTIRDNAFDNTFAVDY